MREIGWALRSWGAVLDGEIVALDAEGRPSFERLQRSVNVDAEATIRRLRGEVPVVYMIFDLLFFDGHSTTGLPYTERRGLLDGLGLAGTAWHTPASHVGDGPAMLEASRDRGLEGVVAKRLDSTYEPGTRIPGLAQG